MKITFDRQIEQMIFDDLMCGDIFRNSYAGKILYMKIPEFHENYNCVQIDNGEPDFFYADDEVFPVDYEFRVTD